jgi:hypothetical protein
MTTLINPALDASGNGNHWNPININFYTTDSTYDLMTDVPALTDETTANYCVLNPLNVDTTTLSNANLTASITGSSGGSSYFGTMALPASSKIYAEITVSSVGDSTELGITSNSSSPLNSKNAGIFYAYNGDKDVLGTGSAFGASYTANDVIGIAVDTTAGTIQFFKNNTSQGTITNSVISSNTMFFACVYYSSNTSYTGLHTWNFGQRPFTYTPPTGFVALNTFNLPTPTIGATASTQANKYFDATTYTGNGSTQSIVNAAGFSPDLVWVKQRNGTGWHILTDSVRGANKQLYTNVTNAEGSDTALITALNSNGFSVGYNGGTDVNGSGSSYVAWQWDANGAGSSNTAGSITSTVSANTSAGFSVVKWTGTGAGSATVGHGLGVAPSFVVIKQLASAGGTLYNWNAYHKSLGASKNIALNTSGAADVYGEIWSFTAPSSTVLTLGQTSGTWQVVNNYSGVGYVAYCFAEVAGYSKIGSYTGTGSSSSLPFIYTGFRPKFILMKNASDSGQYWEIYDTSRDTYNAAGLRLFPNGYDAENDARPEIDILSNGFRIVDNQISNNGSGNTIIYYAVAENPFKYSLAR